MRSYFFITVFISLGSAKGKYCDPDICPNKQQHIACGNSGVFFPSCPSDRGLVQLMEEDIQRILDNHNLYRNKIANGDETGFLPAARMASMVDDFEKRSRIKLRNNFASFNRPGMKNSPVWLH